MWGEPLVQLRGYIDYNAENAGNYPSGPWYQYILTLLGLLMPPGSLMILWGALHRRSAQPWWRVAIVVAVPRLPQRLRQQAGTLHPPRRSRFDGPGRSGMGPVAPTRSRWWQRNALLEQALWGVFWAMNAALVAGTVTYEAKRARVQAMAFLHDAGAQTFAMIQVDSGAMPPRFYSGGWNVHHIDDRRDGRGRPESDVARLVCPSSGIPVVPRPRASG